MNLKKIKSKANRIKRSPGDAIEGERVIALARKIGRRSVVSGSSKHQIQQIILRSNVFCMIDKAFRIKDKKFIQRATWINCSQSKHAMIFLRYLRGNVGWLFNELVITVDVIDSKESKR